LYVYMKGPGPNGAATICENRQDAHYCTPGDERPDKGFGRMRTAFQGKGENMHVTSETENRLEVMERARRRVRRWKCCWDEIEACLANPGRPTDEMDRRISSYIEDYIR